MRRVAIVQRVLPAYRVPFMRALHSRLADSGNEMHLFYGQEQPGTVPRSADLVASWSHRITNRYAGREGREVVWQQCLRELQTFDLVVVEQANRLLLNYVLLAERRLRGNPRIAFWGHGKNFQAAPGHELRQRFKAILARSADWWFAYTEASKAIVEASRVPPSRITVVNNAVADDGFGEAVASVSLAAADSLRRELGIEPSARVALYCGGMHEGKELRFVVEACREVRRRLPLFHLVLIGDGPDLDLVQAEARREPWIHPVGAMFGVERAPIFAISEIMMMPAYVGLAIIDSFLARRPMFTTDSPTHGPESCYLEPGVNGVVAPFDVRAYADAVCEHLVDPARLDQLRRGCERAAARYTLEKMVENFARGVDSMFAVGRT